MNKKLKLLDMDELDFDVRYRKLILDFENLEAYLCSVASHDEEIRKAIGGYVR